MDDYKPVNRTNVSEKTIKRRQRITLLIRKVGFNFGTKNVAKEEGVSPHTIYRDIQRIKEWWPKVDLKEVTLDSVNIAEETINTARKELLHEDPQIRLAAARTLGRLNKDRIEVLERFGIKEKPDQNVHVTGQVETPVALLVKEFFEQVTVKETGYEGLDDGAAEALPIEREGGQTPPA